MADYGLKGSIDATSITSFEKLKLALTGEPGAGKSWCAATARRPILVHDFDGRKESLAGKSDVQIISYKDMPILDRWPTFLANLGMMEYKKSKNEPIPMTNVIDSATHASEAILQYIMGNDSSMRRELKTGVMKITMPKSFDTWMADSMGMKEAVERLFALGDTIVTFHERAEEAPDSKAEDKKFTGRYSIEPKRYKTLLSLFNEHWRCMPRGSKTFMVLCRPSGVFTAKTAMNLDDEEIPNIAEMIKKHLSRVGK